MIELAKWVFCGLVGMLVECIFTGFHSLIFEKDIRLPCRTYLWSFLIYAIGGSVLRFIHNNIVLLNNIYLNAAVMSFLIYVPVVFGIEALSGKTIEKLTGKIPWQYGQSKFTPLGLINLKYSPAWLILCFLFDIGIARAHEIIHAILSSI